MIRVLLIGPDATPLAARLRASAPGVEVEDARLPASGIRAFEQSPSDVVVLCGPADRGRLPDVLQAVRARPLGAVIAIIAVSDAEIPGADIDLPQDAEGDVLRDAIAEVLGLEQAELQQPRVAMPAHVAPQPAPAAEVTVSEASVAAKLRQVRHETYFEVLELQPEASPQALREAFARLVNLYAPEQLPRELQLRLSEELEEVRDGLEDAYAVLSNERLRAAYTFARGRA